MTATASWVLFERNIERSRAFLRMFRAGATKAEKGTKRRQGRPHRDEQELLRAAVVFSLGALDAYLSEVSAEVLVAQLESTSTEVTVEARQLLERVAKEIPGLTIELALTKDSEKRMRIARQALLEHLTNRLSNHGTSGVASTLSRLGMASAKDLWDRVNADRSCWPKLIAVTERPEAVLNKWTEVRHAVIHQGEKRRVALGQVEELVDFVTTVGRAVERVALAAMPAEVASATSP